MGYPFAARFSAPPPGDSTVRSTGIRRGPSAQENPHAHKGRKRTDHPHRPRNADGQCDAALLGPGMPSGEIGEPDGAPLRVKLMGEELVAFRDTEGRIGLVQEYCPHRP